MTELQNESIGNDNNAVPVEEKKPDKKIKVKAPTIEEQLESLKQKVVELESVADKGRLENLHKRKNLKITPVVNVSFYKGSMVTKWDDMVMNSVYRDSDNQWHEKQVIRFYCANGEEYTLDYIDFIRLLEKKPAELIQRVQESVEDDSGLVTVVETFKLKLKETGELFELPATFVNLN